jgi:hypothetical protein
MNSFIGRQVLPELLTMSKVGIYIDAPDVKIETLADAQAHSPYIYLYRAEDIRSWSYVGNTEELATLLLRDHVDVKDPVTGLVTQTAEQYRYLRLSDDGGSVEVMFFDSEGSPLMPDRATKANAPTPTTLELDAIPFVIAQITESLLKDAADYQIAQTNLASADLNYGIKSNYPFYTEQFDPNTEFFGRTAIPRDGGVTPGHGEAIISPTVLKGPEGKAGQASQSATSKNKEITVGASSGRRYPIGTERPSFIHPSSEPLMASMDKQERMKQEIRQLVNLALSSISPMRSSAESKEFDERGLEAGLSYIGLELEFVERKIARIWAQYEKSPQIATIQYPKHYSIKSEAELRAEAQSLKQIQEDLPSQTFKKVIARKIAQLTVGTEASLEEMELINNEISAARIFTTNPDTIRADHEAGFVSDETASQLRGYPESEVAQAKKDHAERLTRIAISQSAVRGVPETDDPRNPVAKADKEGQE